MFDSHKRTFMVTWPHVLGQNFTVAGAVAHHVMVDRKHREKIQPLRTCLK